MDGEEGVTRRGFLKSATAGVWTLAPGDSPAMLAKPKPVAWCAMA